MRCFGWSSLSAAPTVAVPAQFACAAFGAGHPRVFRGGKFKVFQNTHRGRHGVRRAYSLCRSGGCLRRAERWFAVLRHPCSVIPPEGPQRCFRPMTRKPIHQLRHRIAYGDSAGLEI
jgi:hypothetical protein